jgi:hypothetical protein
MEILKTKHSFYYDFVMHYIEKDNYYYRIKSNRF